MSLNLYSVDDWVNEQCAICCSPMREWCDDPSSLNEHYSMEIIILSCKHFFHKACLAGALEVSKVTYNLPSCPLCRRKFKKMPDLGSLRLKRTKCRYRKSLSNPNTSCKRPEAYHNMGFCRVHLPRLEGLTDHGEVTLSISDLGNRKLLYMVRDFIQAAYAAQNVAPYLASARIYLMENPHETYEKVIQRLGLVI